MVLNILHYGTRHFSVTLELGGSHPIFSSPEKQPEMMKSEGILRGNIVLEMKTWTSTHIFIIVQSRLLSQEA